MAQQVNTNVGNGLFTSEDVKAWYAANPLPASKVEASFPRSFTDQEMWSTVSPTDDLSNVQAVQMNADSPVPVIGNSGLAKVSGDFMVAGLGVKMEGKEIAEFEKRAAYFASNGTDAAALDMVNYYGNFSARVRAAQMVHYAVSCWGIVSNACKLTLDATISPFIQGVASVEYPLSAWQKNAVTTSWADKTALILNDIQSAVSTGEANGKNFTKIFINQTWFNYVRNNEQIQKYCATTIGNLTSTYTQPTLEAVNSMLSVAFDGAVEFEIVKDKFKRLQTNGTYAQSSIFQDGVAVFAQSLVLGRFGWRNLPGVNPTIESREDFYTVGTVRNADPNMIKVYTKSESNGIVDTFADNFYLKINAVAW